MDFPPCAGPDLFFRVLFASISGKGTRRHERSSSRQGLSSGGHIGSSGSAAILVRSDLAVERFRQSDAGGNLLGRIDCFGNFCFQCVAARNASYLFRVLSVVRSGCAGFFRVSIGWDAARSGFHIVVFCAAWILAGIRTKQSPVAHQYVLAAMGMVPDLFRIGSSEDSKRRSTWRNFTAMDNYYQNGPLPTWIGWYVQHFPHWFHAGTVVLTFAVELVLVWMLFLPRRFRIICFCIVTPFEIGIILTANYTFLNYIVLSLGFLLLDDRFVEWILPRKVRDVFKATASTGPSSEAVAAAKERETWRSVWRERLRPIRMAIAGAFLGVVFYATTAQLIWMFLPTLPLPMSPVSALEPFRIANRYGLFAVMTPERLEIEFQGSSDGKTWIPYAFRYKPQDLKKAPGIYAPYQPRFDWNLWFASLGGWRDNRFVLWAEERILQNDADVLHLFAGNPFAGGPQPIAVRAVIYQYWFTDEKTKDETGDWWRRELLGAYAPALERQPDGRIGIVDLPIARESPR